MDPRLEVKAKLNSLKNSGANSFPKYGQRYIPNFYEFFSQTPQSSSEIAICHDRTYSQYHERPILFFPQMLVTLQYMVLEVLHLVDSLFTKWALEACYLVMGECVVVVLPGTLQRIAAVL